MPHSAKKVYLIHGWAANRHVFDDLIPRLPADWQIRALDLPGHGDAPFAEPFDIAAIAETFAAQIDAPAHILGWSLGGLVALYLAALYPDKIRSLCLTASFARLTADADYPEGLSNPALGKMVGAFGQDYAKHIKQFLQLQLLHTPNAAEIIGNILPDLSRHGAPPALQAALDAVNQADARPLLSSIQARIPQPPPGGQRIGIDGKSGTRPVFKPRRGICRTLSRLCREGRLKSSFAIISAQTSVRKLRIKEIFYL